MNKVIFSFALVIFGLTAFSQKVNLVIPMGHAQKVNHIEVNFDYTHLGSVDDSNIIHIWDTKTKREIYQLKEHNAGIVNIEFHSAKNELISSDREGVILVWDYVTSTVLKKIATPDGSVRIAYLNDGKHIVSAAQGKVKIWDAATGAMKKSVDIEGKITALEVSKFNGQIALGTQSGRLIILTENLEPIYTFSDISTPITTISAFKDRDKLFVGREDGNVDLMNIDKQKLGQSNSVFKGSVGKILIDHKKNVLVLVGNDPNGFVKMIKTTYEDRMSPKFKWSSTPKGDEGLKALAWADSSQTNFFIADHDNVIRHWHLENEEWVEGIFKGTARPIYDIDVDGAKQKLIIASKQSQLKVYDLSGESYPLMMEGHSGGIMQLDYHPDKNLVVSAGKDGEIKIWNTTQNELKARIKKADYLDFNIQFTDDKTIIRKVGLDKFELYSFRDESARPFNVSGAKDLKLSPDGLSIVFDKTTELAVYKSHDLSLDYTIPTGSIRDFSFSPSGLMVLDALGKVTLYERNTKVMEIPANSPFDRITGLSNGDFTLHASSDSNLKSYQIKFYSMSVGSFTDLVGHTDHVTKVLEVNDNLLTSSLDGSIRIWKKKANKFENAGTMVPLRQDNFVITTPDQLFDASTEAMQDMHYTRGNDIIALEQLKDSYYEPNLLPKLLGFEGGTLRKPLDISQLGIYPELQITHPNLNNGKLGIKITNKGGGIGRVVLVINGKEVASDVREIKDGNASTMGIEYDIQGHPYMHADKVNKITIKAYNKDGTLGSEPHNILVLPSGTQEVAAKPRIFAIVIGTSDYASDDLDLTYAAKDAQDFAAALRVSSANLIGGNNITMSVLTTNQPQENWPSKENIKKVFEKYSLEAKARDYLVVYMAGHGVNSGGENGDFYYLTCTAKEGKVTDEKIRTNDAISSTEFTEYIKKVPALKQVMIVDACHSGTLTSAFGKNEPSKLMDSEELRAFERMKDRTGLFLLAGSAADAVSYETTLYGQGLLTYALLFGMKGAALRDGEFIDVLGLFQFAAKKVPQLAEDIGGIQRPEVRVPSDVASFDIGKMNDVSKQEIKLLSPKPVFVQTIFQNETEYLDDAEIGLLLDERLATLSKAQNAPLVFMSENKFGGAMQVRGRYSQKGGLLIVDVKVFQDNVKVLEFKTDGISSGSIADRISARLQKFIVEKK